MKNSISRKSKAVTSPTAGSQQHTFSSPPSDIADQIAISAYFRAEARGFEPGHELEDWLAAEAEAK